MAAGWVAGWKQTPIAGRPGLPFRVSYPFRFTLHTTEGSSAASAIAAYRAGTGPPHVTTEYRGDTHQHIPVTRGAYALRHPSGTPETNALPNVQIELVGYAKDTRNWGPDQARWVADVMFRLAGEAKAAGLIDDTFELTWPTFYDTPVGLLASTRSPYRNAANWTTGRYTVFGHQHVPENTHWDPGALPMPAIAAEYQPDTGNEQLKQRIRRLEATNTRLRDVIGRNRTQIGTLKANRRAMVDDLLKIADKWTSNN